MKAFRFKKHRMTNVKMKILVVADDQDSIIPAGCKYDVPPPPRLGKPKLPRKFFTKVTKPSYAGRVELSFEGLV